MLTSLHHGIIAIFEGAGCAHTVIPKLALSRHQQFQFPPTHPPWSGGAGGSATITAVSSPMRRPSQAGRMPLAQGCQSSRRDCSACVALHAWFQPFGGCNAARLARQGQWLAETEEHLIPAGVIKVVDLQINLHTCRPVPIVCACVVFSPQMLSSKSGVLLCQCNDCPFLII